MRGAKTLKVPTQVNLLLLRILWLKLRQVFLSLWAVKEPAKFINYVLLIINIQIKLNPPIDSCRKR